MSRDKKAKDIVLFEKVDLQNVNLLEEENEKEAKDSGRKKKEQRRKRQGNGIFAEGYIHECQGYRNDYEKNRRRCGQAIIEFVQASDESRLLVARRLFNYGISGSGLQTI